MTLIQLDTRISPAADVMFRNVGDESVLLNLKNETYLGLDAVGTRMWIVLTSADSVQTACELLLEEFDVDPLQLRRDLDNFVEKLVENELVLLNSLQPDLQK